MQSSYACIIKCYMLKLQWSNLYRYPFTVLGDLLSHHVARNPPDLHNWHLLVFCAITSHISTCVTPTCYPVAATIKLTKLFSFHHRLIACLSSGPASCRLCSLKCPERKVCPFLLWTHGLLHEVCLGLFVFFFSLQHYAEWKVTHFGVNQI